MLFRSVPFNDLRDFNVEHTVAIDVAVRGARLSHNSSRGMISVPTIRCVLPHVAYRGDEDHASPVRRRLLGYVLHLAYEYLAAIDGKSLRFLALKVDLMLRIRKHNDSEWFLFDI